MFRVLQTIWHARASIRCLGVLLAAMLTVAGCGGDSGDAGPPGESGNEGPTGPASGSLPDVSEAATIIAVINRVTIASPPVVEFMLTDERGVGLVGLDPGSVRFTVAKLEDGILGDASAWQSYINRIATAGEGPGTEDQVQATREAATAERLVDHGDGTYTYTFGTDVTNVSDPIQVTYDANLTHRVGLEIRGLAPVINPTYTFRPADGATRGIFTRDMVNEDSCNACHDRLAVHGGARFATAYCVTCHNPGTTDAYSGNTVDFKVMIHKIHRGASLPSIVDGSDGDEYNIEGNVYARNVMGETEGVVFPQDIRNCRSCHDEDEPATPDAGNWLTKPTMEACGSCHDDVDFATGENHFDGAPAATNTDCQTCHGPGKRAAVDEVHRLLDQDAAQAFRFNILGAADTGPNQMPTVRFSITDPTNSDAPYDIANDEAFTQDESRIAIVIGWDTVDYTNTGSGSEVPGDRPGAPAQVVSLDPLGGNAADNGDGSFSITANVAVPSDVKGSLAVGIEGHTAVDLEGNGIYDEVAVTGAVDYFAVTGDTASARRMVVDIDDCNACHQRLSLHGGNRTDEPQLCVMCHNANATDIRARNEAGVDATTSADGKKEEAIDLKHMIHAIHAGDIVVYGFGGGEHDFRQVEFPGRLANCATCHEGNTFYPVDQFRVLATTIDSGADLGDPTDDVNISPNASACWGCHKSEEVTAESAPDQARSHMILNGASFNAMQAADGTLIDNDTNGVVVESCVVCHGEGRSIDVATAHGVN